MTFPYYVLKNFSFQCGGMGMRDATLEPRSYKSRIFVGSAQFIARRDAESHDMGMIGHQVQAGSSRSLLSRLASRANHSSQCLAQGSLWNPPLQLGANVVSDHRLSTAENGPSETRRRTTNRTTRAQYYYFFKGMGVTFCKMMFGNFEEQLLFHNFEARARMNLHDPKEVCGNHLCVV